MRIDWDTVASGVGCLLLIASALADGVLSTALYDAGILWWMVYVIVHCAVTRKR